jgi:xanthine dehydrogenase YagS FAD-binding subunit
VTPETDITREHSLGVQDVIASIVVPRPKEGSTSAYGKQGEKASFDWPLAEVAVALEMQGGKCSAATVVLGAAAPVPRRASAAEKILVGKPVDEATARMAAKVAMQGATPLAHNGYKVPIFQTIIRRTILAAGSAA